MHAPPRAVLSRSGSPHDEVMASPLKWLSPLRPARVTHSTVGGPATEMEGGGGTNVLRLRHRNTPRCADVTKVEL